MPKLILFFAMVFINACELSQLNNPYPDSGSSESILYSSFSERPKHLDPAVAYSSNEYVFIGQIYEPAYQYHFLKRPYQLEALTAESLPVTQYYDRSGQPLNANAAEADIAYSEYIISIKPGIQFQPHPAFYTPYHQLDSDQLDSIDTLQDFEQKPSRELVAEDYIYQIKRLAHPKIHSPIAEVMKQHIIGFKAFSEAMKEKPLPGIRNLNLEGVSLLDRYTYRIKIKGKYPQFKYWLAMPFFAAVPWEADVFYQQQGLIEKNITLDWFPIGTGPYMLTENNPNRRMVLEKNPNFHDEFYPDSGELSDKKAGLLNDAGQKLPFIDKVVYMLEKETIPYWNKFLQGYYDASGISSDSFDQAVQFSGLGEAELTDNMREKKIQLQTSVATSIFYMGFNMLDEVIGGDSSRARQLRQAISIAIDYEEFIAIFMNGRGLPAQGLLPPGIYGHVEGESGINPYVYDWVNQTYQRKNLADAKMLMKQAGYEKGIDPATGQALTLYFDTPAAGVDDRPRMNWYRKQLAKLGINLIVRATDYNRFQEKMRNGGSQLFFWGWNADYPDPENFFFLLYGGNGKVKFGGENAVNYKNSEFDALFEKMRNMENGAERLELIQRMQAIVQKDAPWVFGFHPKNYALYHDWYANLKPNLMANNRLKYTRINADERALKREDWNQPVFWPFLIIALVFFFLIVPAVTAYKRRSQSTLLQS